MPDTGAPWNIPYVAGTDLVADWPTDSQTLAEAVADGLDAASGFDTVTTITASDASWAVPTLGSTVVRVTVIGGGGGGGAAYTNNGSAGGTTTFNAGGAGTVTASGGIAGLAASNRAGPNGTDGFTNGNGGHGGSRDNAGYQYEGGDGEGGAITVAYLDLDGISTVNVSIGAGGAGGAAGGQAGGTGGDGVVVFEYRAG